MKGHKKSFISGFLLALILMCGVNMVTGSGASASNGKKAVTINYKDIKICIDGQYITPKDANGNVVEPFILNGTTYLPIRAVGSALGKAVDYDGTTHTVYIGQKPTDGIWSVSYYVDDFNQATSDWYIVNKSYLEGTFSNSATTNSQLLAEVVVDSLQGGRISFFLYEYGSYQVKNNSSSLTDEYSITMRTQDGTDYAMTGFMAPGSDRIFIDTDYVSQVIDAMKKPGIVSFYVKEVSAYTSGTSYLFSCETSNFSTLYAQQMG